MKKKETLNFRVSPEFKRRLTAEAGKERRSITNYVETTLTAFWEQQEERPTTRTKKDDGRRSKNP
jgi:HicB family